MFRVVSKHNVEVDLSHGGSIDHQLARIVKGYCQRVGGTAKARAQQIIGQELTDRTGKLKSGIAFDIHVQGDKIYLEFYHKEPYATFQEEGTGIYGKHKRPIKPKTKKLLSWIDPNTGQRVWAKEVRGTPAIHFMERAIKFAVEQETGRVNK